MGCRQSTPEQQQNLIIEDQLKHDKQLQKNEVKLLLLGAGESGKSTIVKQMKLIHFGSYNEDEKRHFKKILYSNTIVSMRQILEAMSELGIKLEKDSNQPNVEIVFQYTNELSEPIIDDKMKVAVQELWSDCGVRNCFDRSREYQLNDSAQYCFDSISRFAEPGYMPSDQDILRCRVKTTGITETFFNVGKLSYRMVDVGGQRSERKKWIHCFESVTAILFMAALNEYDQKLIEDENVNRMQEAFSLFESVCNSKWFVNTAMILFLNKIDILENKITKSNLAHYFPDFEGDPFDFNTACEYFKMRFLQLNKNATKQVYCHFTCATDTNQIKFVMSAVNDIVVQANLRECGLL